VSRYDFQFAFTIALACPGEEQNIREAQALAFTRPVSLRKGEGCPSMRRLFNVRDLASAPAPLGPLKSLSVEGSIAEYAMLRIY
jgi:hypothetical protein